MTTPPQHPPPPPPEGYGALPPAPDPQGGGSANESSYARPGGPWALVIGLGALAVVLVLAAIVTAGIVLLRGSDDPSAGPAPATASSPPTSPSPSAGSSTPDPGGLADDLFAGEWNFKLGDVQMDATYVAAKDYPDCGPIASAALEKKGCRYAAMGIHDAEGGKLRLLRIIYVFDSDAAASAAATSAKETDFDLPTGSLIADDVIGKWVAKDSSKAVVVGFVTAQKGVTEKTADEFLHYGTADIAAALGFMDL
ncbi:hypothetical protein FB381_0361 [Nocardioides albertanoniae]|uniref:Uncharacterized protein n=1 Tax=Nocardioides albertanoniae TaxID=1175486 RepID=A0A543A1N9_9ACTN|nr:hypothetical protein [Nocardioides albertanoniae]TQL66499.1 hypothetical protein FB381_0361 [Nocardioides albertanoniae]